MPLQCPHCQIAQAEENTTCINCGQSLTPAPAAFVTVPDTAVTGDPPPVLPGRRDSWRLPALAAAALALAFAGFLASPHKPPGPAAPAAPPPTAAAPMPAALLTPPAVPAALPAPPLTVTLTSASGKRHLKVGDAVTLTAFTGSARDRRATLTLFYQRGRGRRTLVSFVQGSLCSLPWTAPAPGRYEFTATAFDSRRVAVSHPVVIAVDRPAPPRALPRPVLQTAPAVAALPPKSARRAPRPRIVRRAPPLVLPRTSPAPPRTYYVAAAVFAFSRSADVLADALSRRGYHAVSQRTTDPHGKTVYAVVTGRYPHPGEAHMAALALQRSGYPAYFFGSR